MFKNTLRNLTQQQRATLAEATAILETAWQASESQPLIVMPKDAKPSQRRSVAANQRALIDFLRIKYAGRAVEYTGLIVADGYGRLLAVEQVTRGQDGQTRLSPRDIAGVALPLGGRAVIPVHNHPGGNPTPSQADLDATQSLASILHALEIHVVDHIVIAAGGARSILRAAMLKEGLTPDATCWPDVDVSAGADDE